MKKSTIILSLIINGLMFSQQTSFKFDLGSNRAEKGYIAVTDQTKFDHKIGYGFMDVADIKSVDRGGNALKGDFITSDKPFYFSVILPEGNYDVKLTFGDTKETSNNTVRVENRRLMLDNLKTKKGEVVEKLFTVNVKDSIIRNPQGQEIGVVKLKSREVKYLHWDNMLTIEFNDKNSKVSAITIEPNTKAKTIFITGDSTVVDYLAEPYGAWGQMLPYFFKPGDIAINNNAESGETLLAFESRKRIDKIWNQMKPGDYLFIQFAHNDQKPKSANYLEAHTGYKNKLKEWIQKTKKLGGIPVLVTSMNRRSFDEFGKIINTHGDYPAVMKEVAKEENIALIDLQDMSKSFFEALGPEESKKALIHFPANSFPNQPKALADDTHFSTYGAFELAQCVVKSIVEQDLPLKQYINSNYKGYDPNKPAKFEDFHWPVSAFLETKKPDGN